LNLREKARQLRDYPVGSAPPPIRHNPANIGRTWNHCTGAIRARCSTPVRPPRTFTPREWKEER
jgi:hypothetical protein